MAEGLQLDTDMRQQTRMWRIERVGWAVMALTAGAALLGALGGGGPLSRTEDEVGGGALHLTYDRVARHHGPLDLELKLRPPAGSAREVTLWLDQPYLDGVEQPTLVPEPVRTVAAGDRVGFVFPLAPGAEAITVRLRAEADTMGWLPGRVAVEGGPVLAFRTFVLP